MQKILHRTVLKRQIKIKFEKIFKKLLTNSGTYVILISAFFAGVIFLCKKTHFQIVSFAVKYKHKFIIIANRRCNEMRVKITLACTECKQRNYDTMKNKKNDPDRLEMNKYCRFCRKHTLHKETK